MVFGCSCGCLPSTCILRGLLFEAGIRGRKFWRPTTVVLDCCGSDLMICGQAGASTFVTHQSYPCKICDHSPSLQAFDERLQDSHKIETIEQATIPSGRHSLPDRVLNLVWNCRIGQELWLERVRTTRFESAWTTSYV